MYLLFGCRSNTNDGSSEENKGKNLNCPCATSRISEFMIENNTQKSRNKKSATAKGIANGISQCISCSSITKVTDGQQSSRPNGRPPLFPGRTEVFFECTLWSFDRMTHNNATCKWKDSLLLAKRPRSNERSKRYQKEDALQITTLNSSYIWRHRNACLRT